MSWALPLIFLTYPWIFYTGNLPREASVTLLNTLSRGKKAIYHGKSAPCNRTYYAAQDVPCCKNSRSAAQDAADILQPKMFHAAEILQPKMSHAAEI